jgi:hypothetical protein
VSVVSRTLPATLLTVVAAAAAPGLLRAQASRPLELATYPRTTLEVREHHGTRRHAFDVWVADTPERAEQGLMFVSDLPETRGMLFPLPAPRIENMWMKNTYVELDMLFIDADRRVAKIIERAHPLSLQILSSDQPVSAVLELKGGAVARLGLKVGDSVSWRKPGGP